MSDQDASPIDPELTAIEAALGSLRPTRSRVDRDQIMFRLGQTSARPKSTGRSGWRATAAALALVASVEGAFLWNRPGPQVVERIVVVREPAPLQSPATDLEPRPSLSRPADGLGVTAHERLAVQVLRYGLDGLPRSASADPSGSGSGPASTRRQIQDELSKDLMMMGDPS